MTSRRVVITGLGLVSPLGNEVEAVWQRLLAGESGIGPITRFDASRLTSRIAGEVRNFEPHKWVEPRDVAWMDDFIAYGAAAAKCALDDSGLLESSLGRDKIGVNVSSAMGGLGMISRQAQVLQQKTPRHVPALFIPFILPDSAGNYISIQHRLTGPNHVTVSACATSANSVGESLRLIQSGQVTAMLAGGTDSLICELSMAGFSSMRALSTRNDAPEKASRPFDADRDGFVMAEGAAVLVLEEFEHAVARGAHIYAEIVGYGSTADAHHITQPIPDGSGPANCMRQALADAGIDPDAIGYINAHGTSTQANDRTETNAIRQVWGERAAMVPISSTKSMTGHLLGAAGAAEAIFCVLALRDGVLPPTINLDTPDPACDLDYIPHQARKSAIEYALSNSFGFGGHNASLVLKRFDSNSSTQR
jgi:3-oxoacyl-[acyl-carrier-protein] synthase II